MQNIAAAILLFISLAALTYYALRRFPSFRPLISWLAGINRCLPLRRYQQFYETALVFPGQEGAPEFHEFLAMKELLGLGAFLVFSPLLSLPLGAGIIAALVFFMLPDIKFQERIKKRRESLRRAFIPFIDLIVLILESGVDFVGSLHYLVARFPAGDLSREVEKVLLEIKLGTPREKALLAFAERTNEKELRDFSAAVIASEKSGGSLTKTLKTLSISIKTARIQRAEKAAHEAPVKLLGPLVVFIFPVVFIVLFGPIIISFMQ